MTELGVSCPAAVRVTVISTVRHLCPFKTEVDHGTVRISWSTTLGQTVELHALAALLRRYDDTEISHEQWTAEVAAAIETGAEVDGLVVETEWITAGLNVRVSSASDHPEGT